MALSLTGTSVNYFLADHLGSTVALTNPGGAVTEQTSYDSFGNQTTNLSTRYQFTGREYDQFSGFYYYRARWYDAGLGRFISEDPIGFGGGDVNLYGYVYNSPVNKIDPFGREECPFGLRWYCEARAARDEMEYDLQLAQNTARVINNTSCLSKNYNFLFVGINELARHNLLISSTAAGGQVAEGFSTVETPIPTKPDDVVDSTYDGLKTP